MALSGIDGGNSGRRAKRNLASFSDVQQFFKSWGLYPSDVIDNAMNEGEPIADNDSLEDGLNPEVIEQGINRKCYEKLLQDATRTINASHFPDYFATFCQQQIDATDDAFYLAVSTWRELKENWQDYIANL